MANTQERWEMGLQNTNECENCLILQQKIRKCRKWMNFMSKDLVNAHQFLHLVEEINAEKEKHLELQLAYDQRTREWSQQNEEMIVLLNEVQPLRKKLEVAETALAAETRKAEEYKMKALGLEKVVEQLDAQIKQNQQYTPFYVESLKKKIENLSQQKKNLKVSQDYTKSDYQSMKQGISIQKRENEILHKKLYWCLNTTKLLYDQLKNSVTTVNGVDEKKLHQLQVQEESKMQDLYESFSNTKKNVLLHSKKFAPSFSQWADMENLPVDEDVSDDESEILACDVEKEAALLQDLLLTKPSAGSPPCTKESQLLFKQVEAKVEPSSQIKGYDISLDNPTIISPSKSESEIGSIRKKRLKPADSSSDLDSNLFNALTPTKAPLVVKSSFALNSTPIDDPEIEGHEIIESSAWKALSDSESSCDTIFKPIKKRKTILSDSSEDDFPTISQTAASPLPKKCEELSELVNTICEKKQEVSVNNLPLSSKDNIASEREFPDVKISQENIEIAPEDLNSKQKVLSSKKPKQINVKVQNKALRSKARTLSESSESPGDSTPFSKFEIGNKGNIKKEDTKIKTRQSSVVRNRRKARRGLSRVMSNSLLDTRCRTLSETSDDTVVNASPKKTKVPRKLKTKAGNQLFKLKDEANDSIEDSKVDIFTKAPKLSVICSRNSGKSKTVNDKRGAKCKTARKETRKRNDSSDWDNEQKNVSINLPSTVNHSQSNDNKEDLKQSVAINNESLSEEKMKCNEPSIFDEAITEMKSIVSTSTKSQLADITNKSPISKTNGTMEDIKLDSKDEFYSPEKMSMPDICHELNASIDESPRINTIKQEKLLDSNIISKNVVNNSCLETSILKVEPLDIHHCMDSPKLSFKPSSSFQRKRKQRENDEDANRCKVRRENEFPSDRLSELIREFNTCPSMISPIKFSDDEIEIDTNVESPKCKDLIKQEPLNLEQKLEINIADTNDNIKDCSEFIMDYDSEVSESVLIIEDFILDTVDEADPIRQNSNSPPALSSVNETVTKNSTPSPASMHDNRSEENSDQLTSTIQICNDSVGVEDENIRLKLTELVEYYISAVALPDKADAISNIITILHGDVSTKVALKAAFKVILQMVLTSNAFEQKENKNALPRTIYKLLQLVRLIEINLSEQQFSLLNLVRQMCHQLIVNEKNLHANCLASLANFYFSASYIGYQRCKNGEELEYLLSGRQYLVDMLRYHKGNIHLAVLALLNCSRMTFIRNVNSRKTTVLEKVIMWILNYGCWNGAETIRQEVIDLTKKLMINKNPVEEKQLFSILLTTISDKDLSQDLTLNVASALRLFLVWLPLEKILTFVQDSLRNIFNEFKERHAQDEIDVELKKLSAKMKITFAQHVDEVGWEREDQKKFMKAVDGILSNY